MLPELTSRPQSWVSPQRSCQPKHLHPPAGNTATASAKTFPEWKAVFCKEMAVLLYSWYRKNNVSPSVADMRSSSGRRESSRQESWYEPASAPSSFAGSKGNAPSMASSYLTGREPTGDSSSGEEGAQHTVNEHEEHCSSQCVPGESTFTRPGSLSQPSRFKLGPAPFASVTGESQGHDNSTVARTRKNIDSESASDHREGQQQRSDLFADSRKSSSSDTDCTEMTSTPDSTQDVPEACTRTMPCGVRDEPVAPGACFPSPQASPWRQLCSEMQQVDVDQHSPNLGSPGCFQQLDLQLAQVQHQLLAGSRQLVSTNDIIPTVQLGMHSESATPVTQVGDDLIAPDSSKPHYPPSERSQSCSSPVEGGLVTVTASDRAVVADQNPDVVPPEPCAGMQVLHRPSRDTVSTCRPALCTDASSSCGLVAPFSSDKMLQSSQADSRSSGRETSRDSEFPCDQGGSHRRGSTRGSAVPSIRTGSSDSQLLFGTRNTSAVAAAAGPDRSAAAKSFSEGPRLDSEREGHSAVADAVLAELVSDAADTSFSQGAASHSVSHSHCSGKDSDIHPTVGVRDEGCHTTASPKSSAGHGEGCSDVCSSNCGSGEGRDDCPSSCQPQKVDQFLFEGVAPDDSTSAALHTAPVRDPSQDTAATEPSLMQPGQDADSDTAEIKNAVSCSTSLPSDVLDSSGCAPSGAAEQPESKTQPSTERAAPSPPHAQTAPHPSVTISAGGLSDMSSMMDPGRGATPVAAQSDRLAGNAPASLLIAQSNPLYNSSPDSEGGEPNPGQSCHEHPLTAHAAADSSVPQLGTESVSSGRETVEHLTEAHSTHHSEPSLGEVVTGDKAVPKQFSAAAIDIKHKEPEPDTTTDEAFDTISTFIDSTVNTCASTTVHDLRDTVHDPGMHDNSRQQDGGRRLAAVPIDAPRLADVCPAVLQGQKLQDTFEQCAQVCVQPVVEPAPTPAMMGTKPVNGHAPTDAPRLADVCPLSCGAPFKENEASEAATQPPTEPASSTVHHSPAKSSSQSPHHHLLHPPTNAPRLGDVCSLSSGAPFKENGGSEPATQSPVEAASSPVQHPPPKSGSQSPHHHLLHPPLEPISKPADRVPAEAAAPEEFRSRVHSSQGLAAQRSLLCTALAATKLRMNTQGNDTHRADDPLAPGGLPSIASMLLHTGPSMDAKRPATARTSTQSHFAIAAVHDAVDQADKGNPLEQQPSDSNSADLSVCCTPRVPTHLGHNTNSRPNTGTTAQLMAEGEHQEAGTGCDPRSTSGSTAVSSFGRPENADSAEIRGGPGSIWDGAAKIQPTPRTRTMLRKRADSGIAGALRRNNAGDCSTSVSDCRASGACLSIQRTAGPALTDHTPQLQQQNTETAAGFQREPLHVATSTAEGLGKDVVITQSVQLEEVSERRNSIRSDMRSPSTTSSAFMAPHTCPAALQDGTRNYGMGTRLQPGETWLPLLHGQTFSSRSPSPTTKLGFPRTPTFPSSSPTSKWRKASQLTSKIPKTMPVGWKGLFKRMAGTSASPVPLRPVRSSASLTIKPVLATPRPDPTNILQRLEMSPDKAAHARSVAEQAVSSIDSMLQERQRSNQQAQGGVPHTHAPIPTLPVSHEWSTPPHSEMPRSSPASVHTSHAGLHTSAAVVTLVPSDPPALNASQSTMRTSEAIVTVVPHDLPGTPPEVLSGFPVAGCTPRSRTPSRLGSLPQIRECSEAGSHDASSRITHESIAAAEGEGDVESRLRTSWAGRISGGRVDLHTPPMICEQHAGGDPESAADAYEVEEIELGQSYSEDMLLPMAPLSNLEGNPANGSHTSEQVRPFEKPQSVRSSPRASVGKVVSSFGCNRPVSAGGDTN